MKGKVKWFNAAKKYGYITGEDGKDYFIHASGITEGRTLVTLDGSDEVEFDVVEGKKGPQATGVVITESAE